MKFELPWALAAIPLLLLLLLFARRLTVPVGSRSLFLRERVSLGRSTLRRSLWALPYLLMLFGVVFGIIAFAGPEQEARHLVAHEIETKTAILIDDVSGSMNGPGLIALKAANRAFYEEFCRQEVGSTVHTYVGLVAFDSEASVRSMPTRDCAVIARRIALLRPGGGTSIDRGLWAGLALAIEALDKGKIVSAGELQRVKLSLKEREAYIPLRAAEFCKKYPGVSLVLYTDGDFPSWAETRQKALEQTNLRKGETASDLNPFHVIDVAHALCIRTYFYSVGQIPQAYHHAFTTPRGFGEVRSVATMSRENLMELYRTVATRERSRVVVEEELIYNPLMDRFVAWALACFLAGAILGYVPMFSRQHARTPERR
ncbi:MAG: hypothetical protein A3I44_03845 [Candidatus Sungbacteria bacterium RIFCSPLOWO2_02_FULL_51_17]|nr:MAG: hypothetical protein A2676_02365 [Candidatus Sungbacteria bacterium RIFCSPHIGHO2_01_FULL_51_22]OHA06675.1 MAG: hypothetical protein A3B29_03140 [Candidatus Sungbacteria bacterium RIFCSPLOWO2_01_FULL_51_34]OHA11219.1 MAG: hypothetical protein A3I44_03845 [Candidatus Sungbacteria bacterium RIFCSPLOWO2_02_FULL_51_17]